jgi:hypothetical protein
VILLPQPPECWDYRCQPLCPARSFSINSINGKPATKKALYKYTH